jgi:hypothetical protein
MAILLIVVSDFLGLWRVGGPRVAIKWIFMVALNIAACYRQHALTPADVALGPGAFRARLPFADALLHGEQVLSGIREIWVRGVYLEGLLDNWQPRSMTSPGTAVACSRCSRRRASR